MTQEPLVASGDDTYYPTVVVPLQDASLRWTQLYGTEFPEQGLRIPSLVSPAPPSEVCVTAGLSASVLRMGSRLPNGLSPFT